MRRSQPDAEAALAGPGFLRLTRRWRVTPDGPLSERDSGDARVLPAA